MRVPAPALALLFISATLGAQAPQTPVFRAGVDVVEVDVSVVDSRGRQIVDLLGPEFTVTVDGKPRKVLTAEFIPLRPVQELGAAGPRPVPVETDRPDVPYSSNAASPRGRLIVLAVDSGSTTFGEGAQVLRAAGGFLDKLGPNDKVAFVTVPQTGTMVDFTNNHKRVRAALERAIGLAQRDPHRFNLGVYEAVVIEQHSDARIEAIVMDRFCPRTARTSPAAIEECRDEVRAQAVTMAVELHQRVAESLRALRGVLEALADIDGPKSLVWISEGLPIDGPGGELADIGRLAARARTTVNVIVLDAPLSNVMEAERSPSAREDRDLDRHGLELLAAMTRGVLFPISVNPEAVFQRIENEIAGYYLLGVETAPADRDGKRHSINVAVRRQGATVRARRDFQTPTEADAKAETPNERLLRTLRSPFAVTDLPLRLATYAYQDPASSKVRVVVATEIERDKEAAKTAADVIIGYVLLNAEGRSVASNVRRASITPVDGPRGPLLEDVAVVPLEPGEYILRLAAIDDRGRRGSIEHRLVAWQMKGVPFAVSDLILGDSPRTASDVLHPAVEARLVSGSLATYLELYADQANFFDTAQVKIEVAANEAGPALKSGVAQLAPANDAGTRFMSALVPLDNLPPDAYVARAIITHGDQKIGQLVRPFRIVETTAAAASLTPIASMLPAPVAFQRDAILSKDVLAFFMDVLDQGRPALKAATSQVRSGRFDGAARQAFDAGDQLAAAFLRGLELLTKGDLNQAATQFNGALRISPEFSPASFYLGVCYAVAGRDRDAVTAWRRALIGRDKLALEYAVLSDALFRTGDVQQAVAPLREALAAWPDDDAVRRRLAIAESVGLQHGEALAIIEPYLARHPDDHEALLVALQAIYASRLSGKSLVGDDADRERMAKYARAYAAAKGPQGTLVAAWAAYVARR